MRIMHWSSGLCSSDLQGAVVEHARLQKRIEDNHGHKYHHARHGGKTQYAVKAEHGSLHIDEPGLAVGDTRFHASLLPNRALVTRASEIASLRNSRKPLPPTFQTNR